MATHSLRVQDRISAPTTSNSQDRAFAKGAIVLAGRILFSLLFVMSAFGHFSKQTIGFAASHGVPIASFAASHGVPIASLAVPLSGLLALAGGLSILLGYRARLGAWLIVLFLVPVTLLMHKFWTIGDPVMAQMQQIMFLKNVTMLGGALLISQFGAGPVSLDNRRTR
jgi:putative oxidoreductase